MRPETKVARWSEARTPNRFLTDFPGQLGTTGWR
jgi:hypothetical protein